MPDRARFPRVEALGISIIAAAVGTLARGYRFGFGDQIANLPFVLRALDPAFLDGDFFVVSTELFSPRFYYARVMAEAARFVPLPQLYLALTGLVHAAVAFLSYTAGWSLLRGSRLAGLLAVALVASLDSVQLGYGTALFRPDLVPSHLALPFGLASFGLGFRGRPLACAAFGIPAMLLHPAVGVELAGLGLVAALPLRAGDRWTSWGVAAGVLAVAAGLFWVWPAREIAQHPRLVEVETFFRHPHHSVPTFFPSVDWARMGAFGATLLLAGAHLAREKGADRELLRRTVLIVGAILLLWIGGYVFIELAPSALVAAARPFRLAIVVKWLGLVGVAALAAFWLGRAKRWRDRIAPSLLLLACGPPQPELVAGVAFVGVAERAQRDWFPQPLRDAVWLLLAGATVWALGFHAPATEAFPLLWLLAAAAWLSQVRGAGLRWALPATATALLVLGLLGSRSSPPPFLAGRLPPPRISLADHRHAAVDVARFARRSTPEDAVFVTPPDFGQFRLLAERALVVDFRSFPFSGDAMEEWLERLEATYGPIRGRGYPAAQILDRRYRRVSDATLQDLGQRYRAGYAVLYRDTPTRLPVLYEDDAFKLVALNADPSAAFSRRPDSRPRS